MYYKSFIHDYTSLFAGLLAGLGVVALTGACHSGKSKDSSIKRSDNTISSAFFASCTDDSTRYVHDSRTFGIWYNRGRFDTALHFPLLTDTIQCTTQTAPQLFSIGPNSLWWFDGQLNHRIGGSGSVSAANGLSVDAGSVILGYSQVANLYRAVATITGNSFYGINYSDSLQVGSDNIIGPFSQWSYVANPNLPYESTGPFFSSGWKDPFTLTSSIIENDSVFCSLSYLNTDGSFVAINLSDADYTLLGSLPGGNDFQEDWNGSGEIRSILTQDSALISNSATDIAGAVSYSADSSSVKYLVTNHITGGITNGWTLDNRYSLYVTRLNSGEDSIIGSDFVPVVTFNSALAVTSYHVAGNDASFTLTFTTGTIGASTDSALFEVEYGTPAHSGYAIVSQPSGTVVSATTYYAVMPFTSIIDGKHFLYCGGSVAPTTSFMNNTTYSINFITIDHNL